MRSFRISNGIADADARDESADADPRSAGPATRRAFLGALGGVALSGCVTPGESDGFRAFEARLRERDVRIKRVAADFRRWVLEYYPRRESLRAELGVVGGAYAETVPATGEDGNHRHLEGVRLDEGNARIDAYTVRADWARARAAGTLSEDAYLDRIASTLTE